MGRNDSIIRHSSKKSRICKKQKIALSSQRLCKLESSVVRGSIITRSNSVVMHIVACMSMQCSRSIRSKKRRSLMRKIWERLWLLLQLGRPQEPRILHLNVRAQTREVRDCTRNVRSGVRNFLGCARLGSKLGLRNRRLLSKPSKIRSNQISSMWATRIKSTKTLAKKSKDSRFFLNS